ncbi:MAG: protoglobin domain-containing protein, partial [Myxococcota bacterium]
LRETVEANADGFVQEFYNHLLHFSETQHLLRDAAVRDRLLIKQREYLISLCDPEIDEAYLASRTRIGVTHERIGLETRWYLGAYSLYYGLLLPVIQAKFGHDMVSFERAATALAKRLMFDAEIAIRQYIDRREADLRRLNDELQSAGQALTREVDETHRDLRRTEVRAQAAEQLASVATLLTGLAHEVGTPMGVIRGHAEALERAVEGERAKWRLNMILEQIDRITSIIQSLLNIARPKASLRIPLDLEELIDSSVGFLSEKLRHRAVDVERHYEPVPTAIGDPEKMQQIFLNLFINAIDAMPNGGTLGISLSSQDPSQVAILISDTGSGIPENRLTTIFDPFYTTKAAGHGSGLGLVVVQGIVNEHGGSIDARSKLGEGTEFEIHLPVAPVEAG